MSGPMTCEDEQLVHLFTVPFDAKSGHPTAFGAVHRCAHCGRACVSPMPDIDQIPAHYDIPAYYTHNTSHLPEVTPSLMDRLVTHLAWRTDHAHPFDLQKDIPFAPQDRTGLDIGCGHGNLLSNMRDLGLETFGIDPDEQARAEAEKKGTGSLPEPLKHCLARSPRVPSTSSP